MKGDIFLNIFTILEQIRKPFIVGVNGAALGGGFEIALSGDILVATEDCKLGLPELKLGFIPGLGGT